MAEFEDLDIYGNQKPSGEPIVYIGDQALSASIMAFLTSKKGDYINYPGIGGLLTFLLFKPFTDNTDSLQNSLKDALNNHFINMVTIISVEVTPNRDKKYWEFKIAWTSLITGKSNLTKVFTSGKFESADIIGSGGVQASVEKIDIIYVDDNLLTFVNSKLEELKDSRLLYDLEEDAWVWDIYKLVNLTSESSNFTEILKLINT